MTFTGVVLICLGGLAACAVLVFAVETVVAFCLTPEVEAPPSPGALHVMPGPVKAVAPEERAA